MALQLYAVVESLCLLLVIPRKHSDDIGYEEQAYCGRRFGGESKMRALRRMDYLLGHERLNRPHGHSDLCVLVIHRRMAGERSGEELPPV